MCGTSITLLLTLREKLVIEAIFIVSIVVYLVCRQHQRQQQLTYYVPQRRYIMRETVVYLPNGGQAVHRELEWIE